MRILFGWTNKKKQPAATKEESRAARQKLNSQPIAQVTPTPSARKGKTARKPSFLEKIGLLWAYDIGIDLGTANVLVYIKGKGIVLDEPGYVARDTKTKEVLAVGEEAKNMNGRTPEGIEVIRPLQEGVIADYDMTQFMLHYFISSVLPASTFIKPRVIICVPSAITPVERRAVLEASLQAGARKTVLIEESLAAALGVGLDKAGANAGAMIVDVGGGTTDIAVLSQTGIVVSESLHVGSDDFDAALAYYIRRKRKVLLGRNSAEELKIAVGTVDRKSSVREGTVRGRDLHTGLPKELIVTSTEIQRALEAPVQEIIEGIKGILEKTPPELLAQIADNGIILTGGGALIDGLDRLITRMTGIVSYLAENPRYSVVLGTGKALKEMNALQDTLEELYSVR